VAYHEDVDIQKSQNDTVSFKHPDIIATDQLQIEGLSGKKIFSTNIRVNHRRLKDEYRFWFNPDDKIKKYLKPKHKDLLQIASLLYRLEYNLKEDGIKRKIKPTTVKIQVHSEFDKKSREIIRQLAIHLLDENQTISFEKLKTEEKETSENKEKTDAICLFSCGLDSLAGYYWAKEKYGSIKCIFVNHGIPKVSHMTKDIIKSLGIEDDFYSNSTQGGGYYLQQTRGFLFLTAAAVYADIFKAKNVVLSECGVTKYLPSFSPSDETTKTTSPMMIKLAKLLFENKGINFKLHEPFEDSTKAEIISRVKDSKLLEMTHSCRKSNMRSDKHDCGYCLNCLIKVIGLSYITGHKQKQFLMDPITNPTDFSTYNLNKSKLWKFNYEKYESIKQLINFSTGILSGGEGLHLATKKSVDRYGKPDLFRRFSEDVIYGLSYMKSRDMVKNQEILDQINRYESEKWFDKDRVMRRRVELLTCL
jgi:7-cyano-7-deazaguanine synthase in queuosine biosynthesis